MVQPEDVPVIEPLKIVRRFGNLMYSEKLPEQAHICSARELEIFKTIHGLEFGFKNLRKRLHPGPSGPSQRTINVKQSKADHSFETLGQRNTAENQKFRSVNPRVMFRNKVKVPSCFTISSLSPVPRRSASLGKHAGRHNIILPFCETTSPFASFF